MAFDVNLTSPALIERFEPYFKHPDPNRYVLRQGDRAVACKNAKTALAWLGFARVFGDDPQLYDRQLSEAVERFQKETGHKNIDGAIGPGTRSRLVSRLLQEAGASKFGDLDASEAVRIPTVFLSYAWADTPRVNKLDQWLRDHEIRVIRDVSTFKAGSLIPDNIWRSVLSADKVIAVYSQQSKTRDWPSFEHEIAEQVEHLIKVPVLIYLRLDDTPLKAHDPHRIAIEAQGKTLKQIGLAIQKSLDMPVEPARFGYDEEAPL
jgi:TIR domain